MTSRTRAALVLLIAVVVSVTTAFGYLGGFLAPDRDSRGLPIAVVDLDRGAVTAGAPVRFGADVVRQLRAANPVLGDAVRWDVVATRGAALRRIRADRTYAAVIIPPDLSARLTAIALGTATTPATIEVLTNPASGSYAGAYSQAVASAAVEAVSRSAAARLADTLGRTGVRLRPASALAVGRPVVARVTVTHPVGERGGRGLAPFYFAVVVVVATLFATSALNVVMDVAAGREPLAVLGHRVGFGRIDQGDPVSLLRAKLRLASPLALAIGVAVSAVALGPLAMTVERPALLVLMAVLGAAATAALTLAMYAAFDLAGSVLAALVLVIYGVPASAGVYPVQAMPAFFRFLHSWLPLRYLADGARSSAFGFGPPGAVGRSLAALVLYLLLGVVAAGLAARHAGRRPVGN